MIVHCFTISVPAVTGQKQLLEEFGDLASVKYRWNLEGLDPNDERYHHNVCSDLTDAQVLAKIVQELKNKAITDLAAELTSQGTSVTLSECPLTHCIILMSIVSFWSLSHRLMPCSVRG